MIAGGYSANRIQGSLTASRDTYITAYRTLATHVSELSPLWTIFVRALHFPEPGAISTTPVNFIQALTIHDLFLVILSRHAIRKQLHGRLLRRVLLTAWGCRGREMRQPGQIYLLQAGRTRLSNPNNRDSSWLRYK